jgi:dGTPase
MDVAISRAPYACDPERSRGRLYPEPPSTSRSAFRRDCDRIIHATAFRRLKHKTQVFVFDEGDHYRTRLTHTLEVAQVARALAIRHSAMLGSARSTPACRHSAASITMPRRYAW